jgi:hypothetical protein
VTLERERKRRAELERETGPGIGSKYQAIAAEPATRSSRIWSRSPLRRRFPQIQGQRESWTVETASNQARQPVDDERRIRRNAHLVERIASGPACETAGNRAFCALADPLARRATRTRTRCTLTPAQAVSARGLPTRSSIRVVLAGDDASVGVLHRRPRTSGRS